MKFFRRYSETEVREFLRQIECEATARGVKLGYEFAKAGGTLHFPDILVLRQLEEILKEARDG